MSNIRITGDNSITYEFDTNKNIVYIVEERIYLIYLTIFSIFLLFCVIIYDYIKDFFRVLSGYKDIFTSDNSIQGVVKLTGYTKGNIIRYIIMLLLVIISIVSFYFSNKYTIIALKDVPTDVLKKYNKQYPK